MPDLIVPTPNLKFGALAPGVAAQEQPVEVCLGAVQFPDSSPFTPKDMVSAGFLVYRQAGPGASLDVWDADGKTWRPESTAWPDNLRAQAIAFKADDPLPWQGLLVALGQKDGAGKDLFEKQVSGFPRYSFRARFVGRNGEEQLKGLSPPSAFIGFASMTDQNRAGLAILPDGQPKDATEVRMFLRNAARQEIGSLLIKADGSSAGIEITNFNTAGARLAQVSLLSNGEIQLVPAGGQSVVIQGNLVTNNISYLPFGGGSRTDL